MSSIKVPITKTDKEGFQVIIDLNLYSEKAIIATIYRYTDKFFVYQNTMPSNDKQVCVIFESKDGGLEENIVKQFCNDLIDQQLREITTEKYGYIRDLIVEEAFKPVSRWKKYIFLLLHSHFYVLHAIPNHPILQKQFLQKMRSLSLV